MTAETTANASFVSAATGISFTHDKEDGQFVSSVSDCQDKQHDCNQKKKKKEIIKLHDL